MNKFLPFNNTVALAGWIFADLMLGLAVLFFAANTVGSLPPSPTPLPPPTPTATPIPTATPTPSPTMAPSPTPSPTPPPTPSPTPSPTPPPTPTPTPVCLPVISPDALAFTLTVDSQGLLRRDASAEDQLRQAFRAELSRALAARQKGEAYEAVQIGVILTFGSSPLGDNSRGVNVARRVNDVLFAEPLFRSAGRRDYLRFVDGGGRTLDTVEIEVFLYVRSC